MIYWATGIYLAIACVIFGICRRNDDYSHRYDILLALLWPAALLVGIGVLAGRQKDAADARQ